MIILFNFGNFNYAYFNNDFKWNRIDGEALVGKSNTKYWFKNGHYHRDDGPAIERCDGSGEYYFYSNKYSKNEYWAIIRFVGFM